MVATFSVIYVVFNVYALIANWSHLNGIRDRLIFIGLAILSLGMILMYSKKLGMSTAPANWVINMVDRYIGNIF